MPDQFISKSNGITVVIPAFNAATSIEEAILSVLKQKTSFHVELLIIDDASTDATFEIVSRLASQYSNLRLLKNETNCGKGFCFRKAYAESNASYIHVLDADDSFTNFNKLQIQYDFLENNDDYFAVGHNTLVVSENGSRLISSHLSPKSWLTEDCLSGSVYSHTSAVLYRKLNSELPLYFDQEEFRGDSACFFYHTYKTRKKFKYLPGIWSIYNFNGEGMWSRLTLPEQKTFNLKIVDAFKSHVVEKDDLKTLELLRGRKKKIRASRHGINGVKRFSSDEILNEARRLYSYCYHFEGKPFEGQYAFSICDELCETLGRIQLNSLKSSPHIEPNTSNKAVILVSGLVPKGGGIFQEIKELAYVLKSAGYRVHIVSTQQIQTERSAFIGLGVPDLIWEPVCESSSPTQQLTSVLSYIQDLKPKFLFPIITHNDAIGSAAIQPRLADKVVYDFAYDHGISAGITNSAIEKILTKTTSQAEALKSLLPWAKFSLMPPFKKRDDLVEKTSSYRPLRTGKLVTATAAARQYKVTAPYKYKYSKIVADILRESKGVHVHYGPLDCEILNEINEEIGRQNISLSSFKHIPWVEHFGKSLLEQAIDLFIAPFPVCSARVAIEVMEAGIPILNHNVSPQRLPQAIDFIDPNQFTWNDPDELIDVIHSLDEKELLKKSRSAKIHFERNNTTQAGTQKLLNNELLSVNKTAIESFAAKDFYKDFPDIFFGPLFNQKKKLSRRKKLKEKLKKIKRKCFREFKRLLQGKSL